MAKKVQMTVEKFENRCQKMPEGSFDYFHFIYFFTFLVSSLGRKFLLQNWFLSRLVYSVFSNNFHFYIQKYHFQFLPLRFSSQFTFYWNGNLRYLFDCGRHWPQYSIWSSWFLGSATTDACSATARKL